jgi:putative lipoic acid-binding regulatory protein
MVLSSSFATFSALTEPPKIEFPCEYPIRVIAENHLSLRETVVRIVRLHAPDLAESTVSVRNSREGRYCSVRFSITASGEPQLRALHRALMDEPMVKMVL